MTFGRTRQGPKLSMTRIEKLDEAQEAKRLWAEAAKNGKKGEARYDYVREWMKRDPKADKGWLWRLLRKGKGGEELLRDNVTQGGARSEPDGPLAWADIFRPFRTFGIAREGRVRTSRGRGREPGPLNC